MQYLQELIEIVVFKKTVLRTHFNVCCEPIKV